jgi:hypothetical protein
MTPSGTQLQDVPCWSRFVSLLGRCQASINQARAIVMNLSNPGARTGRREYSDGAHVFESDNGRGDGSAFRIVADTIGPSVVEPAEEKRRKRQCRRNGF